MGQVPSDFVSLIETVDDARNINIKNSRKLAYATQTTLSLDDARDTDCFKKDFLQ